MVAHRRSLSLDPVQAAEDAGLRWIGDDAPGLRRVRAGKGFRYVDADGKSVRDAKTLERIRTLAIPPAWTDVWICASPNGHLQATGRDARRRKQYRYHERWRAQRDETKYDKMLLFGLALPKIRARVDADLALPGLPRDKWRAASGVACRCTIGGCRASSVAVRICRATSCSNTSTTTARCTRSTRRTSTTT